MSEKLAKIESQELAVVRPALTSLDILNAAVSGGITSESVGVVERIIAMRREEVSAENKAKFNKSFFKLRQEISGMDFYADKAAMNNGKVAYSYCSETELSSMLEPVLLKHGFTMMFGQRSDEGKIVAIITLIHEEGHEETREYSVRSGNTNALKDATAADTGATTSAWRHLVIKMLGIKSRIREDADPRNLGGKVTKEQAEELEQRVAITNSNRATFLKMAGVDSFAAIPTLKYEVLDQLLRMKEQKGK
jgi:hypothetical protein